MTSEGYAGAKVIAPVGSVWLKASQALRQELGEAAYGSYLGQASLCEGPGGPVLVTPTGVARDWVRRHAWRRIGELWAQHDPQKRCLDLKSAREFQDAAPMASPSAQALPIEAVQPVSSDLPAAPAGRTLGLQERFSFDNFVQGPANEFAHAVARRVANWSDGHFNPVMFHGSYGFGKTHLMNALAWEAMRARPDAKVVYLSAERFLSTFVRSIMDRTTASFKAELREADLLLIDDIHFIAGKQSTQEELFHTLAALMEDGRRVVFSADRPPSQIAEFDGRLRSHLSAGLICGIEPADRDLRLGILERKLETLGRAQGFAGRAKGEVLEFLADRFTESVRELEGALNTLAARAGDRIDTLSLDEAQTILRLHLRGVEKRITVDDIQKATADHYGLKQADLLSERRNRAIARPRQAAMWLAKSLTTRSLPDIGRRFGGRDHTTVLHAVRRIEELKAQDQALARDLEILTRKLRG